jgi:hypothetical protein
LRKGRRQERKVASADILTNLIARVLEEFLRVNNSKVISFLREIL